MSNRHIYVHGTEPEEQQRLTRLNTLINDICLGAMNPRRGERVLDLGAGLGQMTRAIGRAAGTRVLGIERSAEQIAEALRQAREAGEEALLELRPGDVMDPPLTGAEWGSFDAAHARFILEHVPDPLAVVRAMVRAVRPGGRIVLADDDHDILRLAPEPPGFAAVWRVYQRTYDRIGADPIVGRRLVALLHEGGARPRRNQMLFFGSCAGHPDLPAYVENIVRILEGARAAMVAIGEVDEPGLDAAVAALHEWGRRPDAAIWYSMAWAEGVKPS
ncbi:MAG: methyltransferase domain-containing protein [Candidatus Eisenbacteria bacterium]